MEVNEGDLISSTKKLIDVSIVLNCHDETLFIKSTLDSLSEAVKSAEKNQISTELVVVLDNAPSELRSLIVSHSINDLIPVRIKLSNFGSLGPSRNVGVKASRGHYVWFSDADDLTSSNSIVNLYKESEKFRRENQEDICLFPEFNIGFGKSEHIIQYFSSDNFSPCDFIAFHPFCSRIFAPKKVLEKFRFQDLKKTSGFAFEDWDLNATLYMSGYKLAPAKNVILFYRQRNGSIMRSTDYVRVSKLEAFSNLEDFIKKTEAFIRPSSFYASLRVDPVKSINSNKELVNEVIAANNIDPTIGLNVLDGTVPYVTKNTTEIGHHWAYFLPLLVNLSGRVRFDHVFLLPWLVRGGGEKYLLQLIESILNLDPNQRILLLTLEEVKQNTLADKLSDSVTYIDFRQLTSSLPDEQTRELLFRFIMMVTKKGGSIHLKEAISSNYFIDRYGYSLSREYYLYKYLFSFSRTLVKERLIIYNKSIELLREQYPYVTKFITDNSSIPAFCRNLLGGENCSQKFSSIYAYIPEEMFSYKFWEKNFPIKILWISRVCKEKRIDLLDVISKKIIEKKLPYLIDVYGSLGKDVSITENLVLKYKGELKKLDDAPLSEYQVFLYTSWYDGIPNILLEMMAKGIPIVAPIGPSSAIAEIITEKTGWGVMHHNDPIIMGERYISVIEKLVSSSSAEINAKIQEGQKLLRIRHSKTIHRSLVNKVFGISSNLEENKNTNRDRERVIKIHTYLQLLESDSFPPEANRPFKLDLSRKLERRSLQELYVELEKKFAFFNLKRIKKERLISRIKRFPIAFRFFRKIYHVKVINRVVDKCLNEYTRKKGGNEGRK